MKNYINAFVLIVLLTSCKKPYNPPAISSPGSYLVVEGTINTAGITTIKLSQTVTLSSATRFKALTGAAVTIQSNQNASYPLTEAQAGTYQSASLSLTNTQQYKISIKTPDGQQYASDFEPVIDSPPIDSVGYTITGSGLQLYLNTHDPTNTIKYYRWDYNETWRFHTLYQSDFVTTGTAIVQRTPQQQVYYCFAADTGSNILLANTSHLSESIINQLPLTTVPSTSEKIETEYSIQVNEYALNGDAYTFWSNLKQNTEQLGSIFDPLPSNLPGNIHNITNTKVPVIGYISVGAVQTKRIFIYNQQLPSSWVPTYPYACFIDSEWFVNPHSGEFNVQENLIPLESPAIPLSEYFSSGIPEGYLGVAVGCADCTLRGTTTVPTFWQ